MEISSLAWRAPEPSAKRFVILRHAEKTGEKLDPHLSSEGLVRAEALVALPQILGHIDAIVAATSVPKSSRPVETVTPLAAALSLPIEARWNTHDTAELSSALLGDRHYDGKQIVICWRHDALQALAQALGASNAPAWPSTLYDRIWLITHKANAIEFIALQQIIEGDILRLEKKQFI